MTHGLSHVKLEFTKITPSSKIPLFRASLLLGITFFYSKLWRWWGSRVSDDVSELSPADFKMSRIWTCLHFEITGTVCPSASDLGGESDLKDFSFSKYFRLHKNFQIRQIQFPKIISLEKNKIFEPEKRHFESSGTNQIRLLDKLKSRDEFNEVCLSAKTSA